VEVAGQVIAAITARAVPQLLDKVMREQPLQLMQAEHSLRAVAVVAQDQLDLLDHRHSKVEKVEQV
jgi:hypothetical protein